MSTYEIYITPRAWREVKDLPGHMRQRIRRDIDALATEPRPSNSTGLAFSLPDESEPEVFPTDYELRRLRIDRWRVVYAITEIEEMKTIDILTVQKRPPYDYGDLDELVQAL